MLKKNKSSSEFLMGPSCLVEIFFGIPTRALTLVTRIEEQKKSAITVNNA